jgi:hypothetical protein
MDPIKLAILAALVLAAAVAVVYWRRQLRRRTLGELALIPATVQNPRQFLGLKRIRIWELEVTQPERACHWARECRGHRFRVENSIPVPIAGCGSRCSCRYLPVSENRKRKRRMDPIDQPVIDFDQAGGDRRHIEGRRKEDQWRGKLR